ncbi:MAG: bifunctional pyr operon transcriptional regulator/uracil phosphoribosyltransferase PyrR [Bacteroidetes bacterium]|nr:bifunctional pyr operon transcriptional regulator/uracil phosphoribosyltransferase PyrR [Bacteroidota bacterium]
MQPLTILNSLQFDVTLKRLCYQLSENHLNFDDTVFIGIQPRGIYVCQRICALLKATNNNIQQGSLDITFYRDDFRRRDELATPAPTSINFAVENKKVILMDDVLYTGRTIRAALDALLDYGRPQKVELLVLVDRKYARHLPIAPDYTGIAIDTITSDKVKVRWSETEGIDEILIVK